MVWIGLVSWVFDSFRSQQELTRVEKETETLYERMKCKKIIEASDTHILVLKQLHLMREQLEIASSPRQGFARLYRDRL